MYKIINENTVQNLETGTFIPLVPGNRFYAEYMAWVDKGNAPEPADEPQAPMPTVEEKVNALLAGGAALEDLKQQIAAAEAAAADTSIEEEK